MEVAPFFVGFHHFWSIFTIFYRVSRFTHFCHDLHFGAIYALFPQFFFGQNSLLCNITRFLHVCLILISIWGSLIPNDLMIHKSKYSSQTSIQIQIQAGPPSFSRAMQKKHFYGSSSLSIFQFRPKMIFFTFTKVSLQHVYDDQTML